MTTAIRDVRVTVPIATRSEVSALTKVPGPRLSSWTSTSAGKIPLVHTARIRSAGKLTYPLVGIAEASMLNALREAGLSMQTIRATAEFIRKEHNDEYALASPRFVTDGTDAFIQDHHGLTRLKDQQTAIREVIREHLRPLIIGPDGFIEAFRVERFANSHVTIDPRFNAGQMSFSDTRMPLFIIAGALDAGEAPRVIQQDYELSDGELHDVQENLTWLRIFG